MRTRIKDIWIEAWDDCFQAALKRGATEDEAGQIADTNADASYREKIADIIDYRRLLEKEGRL